MIKINLAPARRRKGISIRLPVMGVSFGLLYALAFAGIAGYWSLLNREAERLRAGIAEAERELASLRGTIAEGSRFRKETEELERRVGLIDRLARRQARPVYLLDAVADAIPRDLWLTSLEEKQGKLRLLGSALSAAAVGDLMANLRRSGQFREVDLVVSRLDPGKTPRVVTFEVACTVGI